MGKSYVSTLGESIPGQGSIVSGMNSRKIKPLPNRTIKKWYHIWNVSDHRTKPSVPISWTRSLGDVGTYYIWARDTDKQVSNPVIVPEVFFNRFDAGVPGGWGNGNATGYIDYLEIEGIRIVREILGIQEPTIPDNDLTKWGVFLSEGDTPTKAEIQAATDKMAATYQDKVLEADLMWEDPLDKKNISAVHRRSAKFLMQERPWCSVPKKMIPCPGCGGAVSPDVAFHGGPNGCGTVINMEVARNLKQRQAQYEALGAVEAKK